MQPKTSQESFSCSCPYRCKKTVVLNIHFQFFGQLIKDEDSFTVKWRCKGFSLVLAKITGTRGLGRKKNAKTFHLSHGDCLPADLI